VLTIIATYFLTKRLFPNSQTFTIKNLQFGIPEVAALLLAISPWHLQFSRIGFESNIAVALNIFGALFFLLALKRPVFLLFSAAIFALNLYMYQSSKVFVPLLVLTLVVIYRKELFATSKKFLFSSVIIGIFIAFPMALYMVGSSEALARAQGVSIFSDTTSFLAENAKRLQEDREKNDLLGLVLDNRRILYVREIVSGYISHFDLNWLFIKGDIARHHAPYMGLLYLCELPFLLIGIYQLVFASQKQGVSIKTKALIFSWFLLAPIPASITSGVPHAVRTLNFLPTFQIFTAFGIFVFLTYVFRLKHGIFGIRSRFILYGMCFIVITFNFIYYLNQYFVQQNYFVSADWQYGYKEAVFEVKNIENKYDKIIVSNKPHLDQSYMFFLFYLQYPPDKYQKEAIYKSGGFRENHVYGKFMFRPIIWETEEKNGKTLFMGLPEDFPSEAKIIKTINFLDGKPAIKIVEG